MKLNRKGQGMIEYLIIVALVAVGTIGMMRVVRTTVNRNFAKIAKSLGAKTEENIEAVEISKSLVSENKDMTNFMNGSLSKSKGAGQDQGQAAQAGALIDALQNSKD